jgi:hypothetical protein
MSEITDYRFIRYAEPEPRIARILLDRPEKANAQNMQLLYELNHALDRADHRGRACAPRGRNAGAVAGDPGHAPGIQSAYRDSSANVCGKTPFGVERPEV